MSTLDELERELASLSPEDKKRLLQKVVGNLQVTAPGVTCEPGVCGGEACIVQTRIPVWVLERARQLGSSEADLLRAYPTLRAQDIVNAWSYVDMHRDEVMQLAITSLGNA